MKKIILISIIILAFVLRFYKLDTYPAINADEASIGYDAYSILQTGKDQHGNSWPINFQSFNDYKPGLYVYTIMPFVKVFSLNAWSIRAPNAFLGVITVYLTYLVIKELFGKDKEEFALVSSLFLAISPWHLHFSRGGWEANTATFLLVLGLYLWVKYFNSYKKNVFILFISFISFIFSIYCYQATRIVTPLFGLGLILVYRNQIFKDIKKVGITFVFASLFIIPLLIDFSKGNALSRASGVGIFADSGTIARIEEQRGEHLNNQLFSVLLHNKVVNYMLVFFNNWTSHFHGEFLFMTGDMVQRNKVPETGVMYLFDIVFLPVGAILLIKNIREKKVQIIFIWLLVGSVASSLTFQAPSALRAENMSVPMVIVSAFGAVSIFNHARKFNKGFSIVMNSLIRIFILWNVVRYGHMYYQHMSKEYPYSSQYGIEELVNYIKQNEDGYDKILITDRYDQPYILFLYYLKYPPQKFQSEHLLSGRDKYGFSTVGNFGKYYFSSVKFDEALLEKSKTMIVGTDEEIPKEVRDVVNIYGNNGFLYFQITNN